LNILFVSIDILNLSAFLYFMCWVWPQPFILHIKNKRPATTNTLSP